MDFRKIINRIPGTIDNIPPEERQGYLGDLTKKTRVELQELLARQNKLLENRKFISKLPDKGTKIQQMKKKLEEILAERDAAGSITDCMSQLHITGSRVDVMEWMGKQPVAVVTEGVRKEEMLDSDDEEVDPLKIVATQGILEKQYRVCWEKEDTLVKPEDLVEEDTKTSTHMRRDTNSSPSEWQRSGEDACIQERVQKIDRIAEKISIKEQFRTNRSLRSGSTLMCKTVSPRHGVVERPEDWDLSEVNPLPLIYDKIKNLSLEESLKLQKEQAECLKEIQLKQAAKKLQMNVSFPKGESVVGLSPGTECKEQEMEEDSSDEEKCNGDDDGDDDCDKNVCSFIVTDDFLPE